MTYRVFLDNVFVSTFEAPDAGGPVSGLSVARVRVTFDRDLRSNRRTAIPPRYDGFSGPLDAIFANFYNSAASAAVLR